MTEYKNLLVEKQDSVLIIRINRERALNAINIETIAELQQLFDSYKSDNSIGCVILTGAGEKSFVAGADIPEIGALNSQTGETFAANGHKLMMTIQYFPKVVIAAINGFALGGGSEIALACDIRLASEKAKLGQPEVNLGIFPGYGGTQRLPRILGRGKAMQLICTGEIITAQEAYRIGLVDEIYPPDQLMTKAIDMAKLICTKSPFGIAYSKECVNRGLDLTLVEGCELERKQFALICGTSDKTEGVLAFQEKRPAKFQGK